MSKFLNTTPVKTIIGGLLQLAVPILIYKEYILAAQILAVAAYTLPGMDTPKFTSSFQFILFCT